MKHSDLLHGKISNIEITPSLMADFGYKKLDKNPCTLNKTQSNDIILKIDGKAFEVKSTSLKHQKILDDILDLNLPFLAWCCGGSFANKKCETLNLQIHQFREIRIWSGDFNIGIDEIIEGDMKNRFKKSGSRMSERLNWLSKEIIIESLEGEPSRVLVSASPKTNDLENAFRIYGKKIAIDVKLEDEKYCVKRIKSVSHQRNADKHPIFLIEGNISFHDITVAGVANHSMRAELKDIISRSKNSYFKLWTEYNQIEEKQLIAQQEDLPHKPLEL